MTSPTSTYRSPAETCTRPEWLFDGSLIPDPLGRGAQACRFLELMRHPKSRKSGRAFELLDWQRRMITRLFGDVDEHGNRRVKTICIMLPRGGRKTSLAAALSLICFIGPERIPGGTIYFSAVDADQARIGFEEAAGILRARKELAGKCKFVDYRNRITHQGSGSQLHAVSSDAGGRHGATPYMVVADEIHAWPKRELFDVLRTGLVKTPNSLLVVISTAGRGDDNIAHEIFDYGRKVQRGEIDDPGFLPVIFETGPEADWLDENVWRHVNPGLEAGFPDIEGLRQLAREAQARPAARISFEQLHLNRWQDKRAHDGFVEMSIYDQGAAPIDLDALKGRPCYLGVDMSVSQDLTAIVAAFKDDDEGFTVLPWFFCPEEGIRKRSDRDKVPYQQWAEQGLLTPTPGNVVDHRRVADEIRALADRFHVKEINFDPNRASLIMTDLAEDGLPVAGFDQSWRMMVPAVDTLKRAILAGKFRHGGNPLLRWCFSNIAIGRDRNNNETFHKAKSTDRIDGAVAAAMAVARAATAPDHSSIYEDEDARPGGFIVLN